MAPLPVAAYVLGLAELPGMGPARLHRLLTDTDPRRAWERVCTGEEVRPVPRSGRGGGPRPWATVAPRVDLGQAWERCCARRIQLTWPGDARWPPALVDDPQPPGMLFWRGDLAAIRQPAVAIVGTRQATPEGRSVAFELGFELARAGITVVSGLALGVDGAAHAGALEAADRLESADRPGPADRTGRSDRPVGPVAATVGVAASGVDVVYPRRHADLWRRVVAGGVVVSETPPGGAPAAWRFPARNRIIVALVRMVVVVESRRAGGSLVTAEAALARGTEVRAVPGPVRAATSAGTNQLLFDGAAPVRHAGDVLDGLGLIGVWRPQDEAALPADPGERAVVDAVGWHPTTITQIVERTGLGLGEVGRHLDRLEHGGWIQGRAGQWSRVGGSR